MAPPEGESTAAQAVSASAPAEMPPRSRTVGTASTFTFLQSLVTIVLSYQLLFSSKSGYMGEVLTFVIVGLLLIVIAVMAVPQRLWRTRLVVGGAILGNTLLCANIFYMAGLSDPGLYITLLLLLAVAVYSPTTNRHFALSLVLCVGYAVAWYLTIGRTGPIVSGDLLRFPVLLTMANFYWHVLGMRAGSAGA